MNKITLGILFTTKTISLSFINQTTSTPQPFEFDFNKLQLELFNKNVYSNCIKEIDQNTKEKEDENEEIITTLLQTILYKLQEKQPYDLYQTVCVSIHSFFNENQRKGILQCVKNVGLKNVIVTNEYMKFIIYEKQMNDKIISFNNNPKIVLLAQFTENEFTMCYLKKENGKIEDLFTKSYLQGTLHFVNIIERIVVEKLIDLRVCDYEDFDIYDNLDLNKETTSKLHDISIQILEKLIEHNSHEIHVNDILQIPSDENYSIKITSKEFIEICEYENVYSEYCEMINEITTLSSIKNETIHSIYLVGNGWKIPEMKKQLFKFFDRNKVVDEVDENETTICQGICFHAQQIERNETFWKTIPCSFGIEWINNQFLEIISQTSELPCECVKTIKLSHFNQNEKDIIFNIFMGNGKFVNSIGMKFIGEMKIENNLNLFTINNYQNNETSKELKIGMKMNCGRVLTVYIELGNEKICEKQFDSIQFDF